MKKRHKKFIEEVQDVIRLRNYLYKTEKISIAKPGYQDVHSLLDL
ncbi:MAG: hypothetical protein PUP90_12215 [Nostoc sp. S4]|nr:hypothetical protein [Nostoc sp. S4]